MKNNLILNCNRLWWSIKYIEREITSFSITPSFECWLGTFFVSCIISANFINILVMRWSRDLENDAKLHKNWAILTVIRCYWNIIIHNETIQLNYILTHQLIRFVRLTPGVLWKFYATRTSFCAWTILKIFQYFVTLTM